MAFAMLGRANYLAALTVAGVPLRRMLFLMLGFLCAHGGRSLVLSCMNSIATNDGGFCFMCRLLELPLELGGNTFEAGDDRAAPLDVCHSAYDRPIGRIDCDRSHVADLVG